tara:strand:+ start:559 stop:864 length:306 start_codon:yes stop_codon:yes gene_type:complete
MPYKRKLVWDELTQQFLFVNKNAYPTEADITSEWVKQQELKKYVQGQKTGYWYEVTPDDRDYKFGRYKWEVEADHNEKQVFLNGLPAQTFRRIKDADYRNG